jgi:hypothetical protein
MLAAGVPMAVVRKRLGHSSLAITSDTYSHLLEGVGQQAATAAAALVPRTDRGTQNEPRSTQNRHAETGESGIDAGHGVGRLGIEPRTRGLKDASPSSRCVGRRRPTRGSGLQASPGVGRSRHESTRLATRLATRLSATSVRTDIGNGLSSSAGRHDLGG